MATLRMRPEDRAAILSAARAAAPDEACGILVGRREGDARVVERVVAARNVHPRPRDAFTIDPATLLDAVLAAEANDREIVGFWHSHPRGPSQPSREDAARATWPDVACVIACLAPDEGLGAWLWDGSSFAPLDIDQ